LAELDHADREDTSFYDADLDAPPAWEVDVLADDEVVASLSGQVGAADLLLLDSIDPRSLSENLNRMVYLRALDRVEGFVAAKRHEVIVAMVGARSCEAYLPEVHLEHEIAMARRTSRYAAGRAIEVARALATTFPGFAAALRDGEVSETHCKILVEKTRVVADEDVLAEIERRVLPKAKRMPAGELGGEVARVIARLDRDAAARAKNARATRRVWSRQLEDGMGYLGVTHDWPPIQAMAETIGTAGRCLQVERGGSGAVAEGVEGATADACRADALAAVVLGERHEDGSFTWDREQVAVTVNVVMDLPTLRGASGPDRARRRPTGPRSDRARGRGVRDLVAATRDRPGRRSPPRLRKRHVPAGEAASVRPRPRRCLPQPVLHEPGLVTPSDGPRGRVPHRPERHGELRCALHDLPSAQDRGSRRHHQRACGRVLRLDHRLGPDHPRPTTVRPPHRARPTPGRASTTDARRPTTLLNHRGSGRSRRHARAHHRTEKEPATGSARRVSRSS
jgi:hypothetical protein